MIRITMFTCSLFETSEGTMARVEKFINENGITKNDIVQFIRDDRLDYTILMYEDNKPYVPETESTESESSSPQ